MRTIQDFTKAVNSASTSVAAQVKVPLGSAAQQARSTLAAFQSSRKNRTLFSDIKNVMGRVGKLTMGTSPNVSPTAKKIMLTKNGSVSEKTLRRNSQILKSELLVCHQLLDIFSHSVLLMDEVDILLHPQRSELRWPVGKARPIDLSSPVTLPFGPIRTTHAGALFVRLSRALMFSS